MEKKVPFFEFCLEPELDTFSDDDLQSFVRIFEQSYMITSNPPYCSDVTFKSPWATHSMPRDYRERIKTYDFYIKLLYWGLLQSGRERLPDSYLLDLIPGKHWMDNTWNPEFQQTRLNSALEISKEYVIPEILRPYVDSVNSNDGVSYFLQEDYPFSSSLIVSFHIFEGTDLENALFCHLIYDVDGLTLVESRHPEPHLTLQGTYRTLSWLFHQQPKWSARKEPKKTWDTEKWFIPPPGISPPYIPPFLRHYNINLDWRYNHIAWYHTHYKIAEEFARTIDISGAFGRPARTKIKSCVISFDENEKLQIKVDYRETWEETYNYYPESLHECFVVFEFIVSNFYWQLTNIYHKGKKPLDHWTVYESWRVTDIYPASSSTSPNPAVRFQ